MDINYNLKTPCSDCPFRTDVKHHKGVALSLPELLKSLKTHQFGHTCHKTDERSDGYVPGYEGTPEHCAGALIMLEKMEHCQDNLVYAQLKGLYKPDELDMKAPVFKSFVKMGFHYKKYIESLITISTSYTDGGRKTVTLEPGELDERPYKNQ